MNHSTLALLAITTIGAFSGTAAGTAASAAPTAAESALTIYNDNFAVVRDTIPLNLTAGVNHVSFTGITSQVEPDSVILRDPAGKRTIEILEQNYRGDTVSQGLLLSLNEGKTIDFQVPGTNGGPPTIVQGTIVRSGYLAAVPDNQYGYSPYNPNQSANTPLIQVNGKLQFGLPGTPLFPALTEDSILPPTLEWTLDTDKAGPLDAELAYVTEGINWKAAYNVVAPSTGSTLDMTAWVTMENQSGKEFDNAKIKLMAGDVNKIKQNAYGQYAVSGGLSLATDALIPNMATQKSLDDYHLYSLPNQTTLRNHETKQVEFLHSDHIASQEIYVYDGLKLDPNRYNGWNYDNIRSQSDYGTQSNTKVAIERKFVNSQANGLGVPMPAGRVRFYRRDDDGQLEFLGEDNIGHTPQNETVKIVTGSAFDIIGNRTQVSYLVDNGRQMLDESFSITLNNDKSTPAAVTVIEHLYREKNWTITTHSDPFDKTDAHTIEFKVQIPANGVKTVTYSAHYTW